MIAQTHTHLDRRLGKPRYGHTNTTTKYAAHRANNDDTRDCGMNVFRGRREPNGLYAKAALHATKLCEWGILAKLDVFV